MQIISAREALEAGLKRYFTGEACVAGHVAPRTVQNGSCVECQKIRIKAWKSKNADKVAQYEKNRRRNNPDVVERGRTVSLAWRHRNLEKARASDLEAKRRIRKAYPDREREYQKAHRLGKLEKLAGRPRSPRCEICFSEEKTVFDHCHASEKFRGWICDRCNKVLGLMEDSIPALEALISYLRKHAHDPYSAETKEHAEQRFCDERTSLSNL